MFLRLRQLCLVAHELEPVVDALCGVLGLQVCHRDPGVERFGLHNALMAVGSSFVEVVAPLLEGTAAGRHLARLGGDGGYMVILDCDDIAPWQRHVDAIGVRVASLLQTPGYTGLQLHPRDTGGALLEINHTPGGDSLAGPYWPAGPHWQDLPPSADTLAIAGATLFSADPAALAGRWAQILQRPAPPLNPSALNGFEMALDNATHLRFLPGQEGDGNGYGKGLARIDLQVSDAAKILGRAKSRGCKTRQAGSKNPGVDSAAVSIGGIWWHFRN